MSELSNRKCLSHSSGGQEPEVRAAVGLIAESGGRGWVSHASPPSGGSSAISGVPWRVDKSPQFQPSSSQGVFLVCMSVCLHFLFL